MLAGVLDGVFANYNVTGAIVIATTAQTEETILRQLKCRLVATWSLSIVPRGVNTGLALRGAGGAGEVIELAPLRYSPRARPLDIGGRDQVCLFASAAADEWARIAQNYVEQLVAELGLSIHTVTVPPYHEFDSAFFLETLEGMNGKSIVIAGDGFYPAFILQVSALYKTDVLVVHPDFICPEFVGPDGLPSLEGSLRGFLSGELSARVQAHADTGWSGVWARMSTEAATAA